MTGALMGKGGRQHCVTRSKALSKDIVGFPYDPRGCVIVERRNSAWCKAADEVAWTVRVTRLGAVNPPPAGPRLKGREKARKSRNEVLTLASDLDTLVGPVR